MTQQPQDRTRTACRPRRSSSSSGMALVAGGLAWAAACGVAGHAHAGSFAEDGTFIFDSAAAETFDFEDGVPPPVFRGGEPITRAMSDTALSGDWVGTSGDSTSVIMLVDLPEEKNRYRVSTWVRGGDVAGFLRIHHRTVRDYDELVMLYPTGRMTSDGWVELAATSIGFDGERSEGVLGLYCYTECEFDAFELAIEGPVQGELNAPCDGAVDNSSCGPAQICQYSECRNVNGWVPPIPDEREATTDYLENRLRFMFAPYLNRTQDLPGAMNAIEAMRTAQTRWDYWSNYMLAVRRLHDTHSNSRYSMPYQQTQLERTVSACFIEGEADLSNTTVPSDPAYLDVLVSHVGAVDNLGLKAGDRLVSVDGMHPVAWSRSLIDLDWGVAGASNHSTFAEHVTQLQRTIPMFAHEIEVIRCEPSNSICGQPEIISVSAIPFDVDSPDPIRCDNRPLRHLQTSPADHANGIYSGIVLESDSTERIYGMEWDSLTAFGTQDGLGAELFQALANISAGGGNGAILDHRRGNGGTLTGCGIVWDWAVPAQPLTFYQTRQRAEDEQPSQAQGLALFNAALANDDVLIAGSSNATNIPVAVLLTQDYSASDWLALGFKDVAPNVRMFGPYQTSGAFATSFRLGYWRGVVAVLASGETFVADGSSLGGQGVEPDEVVLPLQSDLLVGQDTLFNTAIDWVRQEMQP